MAYSISSNENWLRRSRQKKFAVGTLVLKSKILRKFISMLRICLASESRAKLLRDGGSPSSNFLQGFNGRIRIYSAKYMYICIFVHPPCQEETCETNGLQHGFGNAFNRHVPVHKVHGEEKRFSFEV